MSTDIIDQEVPALFGNYVITMRIPEWPHRPTWDGNFDASELYPGGGRNGTGFNSSLWRPSGMCACWEVLSFASASSNARSIVLLLEFIISAADHPSSYNCFRYGQEAFHCITEACKWLAEHCERPFAGMWLYDAESVLGKALMEDIAAGDYETKRQEEKERMPDGSGGYDFVRPLRTAFLWQLFGSFVCLTPAIVTWATRFSMRSKPLLMNGYINVGSLIKPVTDKRCQPRKRRRSL